MASGHKALFLLVPHFVLSQISPYFLEMLPKAETQRTDFDNSMLPSHKYSKRSASVKRANLGSLAPCPHPLPAQCMSPEDSKLSLFLAGENEI